MRRAILVSVMAWLVPMSAAAQPGSLPADLSAEARSAKVEAQSSAAEQRRATPPTQGPMIVETIHSGFLAAPDVKVTEIDHKTSELVGGYAGWVTDDTFFIGGGGYWLANTNRNDPEMAYGGLIVQWLALKSGRLGVGVKGLVGGGEATLSNTISVRVPEILGPGGRVTTPATTVSQRIRFQDGFVIAEPEALLSVRLSKQMRLAAGVGYRFTGSDHHRFGSDRLDGATGSLALQIGGGS
jgi:hypothetical protein